MTSAGHENDLFAICLNHRLERPPPVDGHLAVQEDGQRLDYGRLAAAVRLRRDVLTDQGVGPGKLIGIPGRRSIDSITDLLAVLASGAAFTIVDEDTAVPRRVGDLLYGVLLPGGQAQISRRSGGTEGAGVLADAAYVLSTSGSSGTSKETVVSRSGLVQVFGSLERRLAGVFDPSAQWLQFHPLSFGYSIFEILGPLVFGGHLRVVGREDPLTFRALTGVLNEEERPRVLSLTPSELSLFLNSVSPSEAALPTHIALSGEAAFKAPLEALFERSPQRPPVVLNTYALTETSGQVTVDLVTRQSLSRTLGGYVGRPLSGTGVVLLDGSGLRIPVTDTRAVGEISVHGPAARSRYLDPDEDRRRFSRSAERCSFRTGDLGHWTEDGGLNVVGRADRHIKLGGQWVSLDSLERAVLATGGINEVAVLAGDASHPQAPEHDLLTVIVVPKRERPVTAERIRRQVVSCVPVRVTVRLLVRAEIPRLPSGKVAPRALAGEEPAPTTRTAANGRQEPATAVKAAWSSLLGAGLSPRTNIFELGVDSLGLVTVAGRLSRLLGRRVPPEFFLAHPRIELQVKALQEEQEEQEESAYAITNHNDGGES